MTQLSGTCTPTQTIDQRQTNNRSPTSESAAIDSTPLVKDDSPTKTPLKNNNSSKVISEKEDFEIKEIIVSPTTETFIPTVIEDAITKDAMKDPKIASSVTIINNNNSSHNNNNSMALVQTATRHREMAVDVPDSFVGVTKTAPRYPPPRKKPPSTPETCSLKKKGQYRFSSDYSAEKSSNHVRSVSAQDGNPDTSSEKRTPPTPRISELVRTSKSKEDLNGSAFKNENVFEYSDSERMERIRKYQEEISKRKEDEDRLAREEEFLRSSLRSSQKLRALEKRGGMENSGFQLEEGDTGTARNHTVDGRLVSQSPDGEPTELTRIYEPSELLGMLHNVETLLSKTGFDESLLDLEKLLHNQEFQSLLTLHNKIQDLCCFKCLPSPVCTDAQVISLEVVRALQDVPSKDAKELLHILGKPQFENFMFCHDKVAASQITPEISEEEELLSRVSQYTEESIKIVRIDKTTEPLGATVKNDGEAVIVGRIVKGGVAEKSGLLHEGDEILEVNGLELRGKSVNDVCD
ncbi:MAGUK p55 subfamily member 5, partial [Stegodyphus mimosarum]